MVTTSEPTPDTGAGFTATPLSENAVVVMERRIVARDEQGDPIETPDQCFQRVAHNLSQAELRYGGTESDRAAAEATSTACSPPWTSSRTHPRS